MKVSYRDFLTITEFTNRELREKLHMENDGAGEEDYRMAQELLTLAALSLSDGSLMDREEDWFSLSLLSALGKSIDKEREEEFPLPSSRAIIEKAKKSVFSFADTVCPSAEKAWETLEKAGRRQKMYSLLHLSEEIVFSTETYAQIKNEHMRRSLLSFALGARGLI